MSVIESFLKAKMRGTQFEEFDIAFNVGFCQGDFVNIYGSWENSTLEKVIVDAGYNSVLQTYISRFISEADFSFSSERRHHGGGGESMYISEFCPSGAILEWKDEMAEEYWEDLVPEEIISVVVTAIDDAHNNFVAGVKSFCSEALSQAHDILLNIPHEENVLFTKNFGEMRIKVSTTFADNAEEVFGWDDELSLDHFLPLLNDEATIVDIKVEISSNLVDELYYLSSCYGPDDYIRQTARTFVLESFKQYRCDYLMPAELAAAA